MLFAGRAGCGLLISACFDGAGVAGWLSLRTEKYDPRITKV